jgi:hypothetical protein
MIRCMASLSLEARSLRNCLRMRDVNRHSLLNFKLITDSKSRWASVKSMAGFQYSNLDGNPPYLNAMAQRQLKRGFLEFLDANTPTPIPARYIISFDELKDISIYFLQTGEPSSAVSWEDFDPEAIREAKSG